MNAASVLKKQTVLLGLKADSKDAVIGELLDALSASGQIKDRAAALFAVMEREKKMSTGLQDGLAIPHGKGDFVDHIAAAIGIKKEGVPFDSLDGQPARIIVLTLSPLNKPGPHIQFLAEISKALSHPEVRERLLTAMSQDAIIEALNTAGAV